MPRRYPAAGFMTLATLLIGLQAIGTADGLKMAEGIWQGTLKVSGTELRIVFKISTDNDGSLKAKLDSPDQGLSAHALCRSGQPNQQGVAGV